MSKLAYLHIFISHLFVMVSTRGWSKCSLIRVILWVSIFIDLQYLFLEQEKIYFAHVIMSDLKLVIHSFSNWLFVDAYYVQSTELKSTIFWSPELKSTIFWSLFFYLLFFIFMDDWVGWTGVLSHADTLLVWLSYTSLYSFFSTLDIMAMLYFLL